MGNIIFRTRNVNYCFEFKDQKSCDIKLFMWKQAAAVAESLQTTWSIVTNIFFTMNINMSLNRCKTTIQYLF